MAQLSKDSPAEDRRAAFLIALGETGNISVAARRAKTPRRTIYNWKDIDPLFAAEWEAAARLGDDALEDEAVRRAKDGTLKPIYQGGVKVGTVREFSDALMSLLLKSRKPEKFKDRLATTYAGDPLNRTPVSFVEIPHVSTKDNAETH
jgi:hypothetical protein